MREYLRRLKGHPFLLLLLETTFLGLLLFSPYIFGGKAFTVTNDPVFEYKVMGEEWIRLVKEFLAGNGLPMYSWNTFLGTDFLAAEMFYETGDFFLILSAFISDLDTVFLVETILCLYLSVILMYLFLKEYGIQKTEVRRYISLLYGFGGWAILFYGQFLFHRFYAFMPLLFLGFERYKNKGSSFWVILATALLFIQNFCLMWPASVFFLLYCAAREWEVRADAKKFWGDFLHLMLSYTAGLLLSCVLFLPAAIYILGNSRVGDVSNTGVFWPLKVYLGFILQFITSPYPLHIESTMFYLNDNGYAGWYSLFISIVPFLAALCALRQKKNRCWLIVAIFLLLAVLIKPLSSVMYGFSDPTMRWTFVLEFVLLMLGAKYLDDVPDAKAEKVIGIGYLLLCLADIAVIFISGTADLTAHRTQIIVIFLCLVLSFLLFACMRWNRKAACVLSLVQILAFNTFMLDREYIYDPDTYRVLRNDFAYLQDIDSDLMFRYYIPMEDVEPAYLNYNFSLTGGFMSTKTYNSTYDPLLDPFLRLNGQYTIVVDISDPYAANALGCKYWLVRDEAELPDCFRFSFYTTAGDYLVYENLDFAGFGYTAENLQPLSEMNDPQQLEDTVFVPDDFDFSGYEDPSYSRFSVDVKGNNYLIGHIETETSNILYIPIPNNKGWKVTVDGVETATITVNGGFMGIPVSAGYHEISMNFMTPGLKTGIMLSAAGAVMMVLIVIYEAKRKR